MNQVDFTFRLCGTYLYLVSGILIKVLLLFMIG